MKKDPHVTYEPTDKEFCCPRCGAECGTFFIDHDYTGGVSLCGIEDCEHLHKEDVLRCHSCGHSTTGAYFVRQLIKKNNLVKRPCCNGSGRVPRGNQNG